MAKWADGLKSKATSMVTEATKRDTDGLYKKTQKVESFEARELSEEDVKTLEGMKAESNSRVVKG